MMRWLFLGLALGLVAVLTACPKPMALTTGPNPGITAAQDESWVISGDVDWADRRTIQANIDDDIAKGATVGLIRVSDGRVVSTTLTDAKGHFSVRLSNSFKPTSGELYYMEATKGLTNGNAMFNAVGGDVARLRTIVRWTGEQRQTLSSNLGNINITQMTTAVSICVSLRTNQRPIDASHLIGTVDVGSPTVGGYPAIFLPEAFTTPNPPILPLTMVQRAYDLVADAIAKNRDPVRWIALSSSDPARNTVVLPDAPFSVQYLSPQTAGANDLINLVGSNFGEQTSDSQVAFVSDTGATVSAVVVSVAPDCSRLTVRVPLTAVSGPIYLTYRGKTLACPLFSLAIRDGHSVVDPAGNVYMANQSMNSISYTQPLPGQSRLGVKALLATGLDNPSALTFGPEGYPMLYVACGGGMRKIVKVDVSSQTPAAVAVSTGTAPFVNPTGMAYHYSTGDFYLSDATNHALYRMPAGSTTVSPVTLTLSGGATLNKPRGLSFGPDGKLYIANSGGNNVLVVDVSNNTGGLDTSGLSEPYGVAFDNRGSFYVTNNTGNSVYRKPVTSAPGAPLTYGQLTSFASIPTPGGMDADASGYLFVADISTNGIYRINRQAETYQVAYGISYPEALHADASGLYVLTNVGRILKYDNDTKVLSVFAEGLTTARGLVRDSAGYFYTLQENIKSLVRINPDGSSAPAVTWTNNFYFGNTMPTMRADKLYLTSSACIDPPSTSWAGDGEGLEFDISNLSAPTRRLRGVLRYGMRSMARDESAGAYNGYFYVYNNIHHTITRIQRTAGYEATSRLLLTDPTRLIGDGDIHVDPSGNIWVAVYEGQSGTGGLYVYNSSGALIADYSTRVTKPWTLRADDDGVGVYVSSDQAAPNGYVREIKYSDGSILRTISNLDHPHGFTFTGTTMYVDQHGGTNQIGKVANYATSPGAPAFFRSGGWYDILYFSNGLLSSSGGVTRTENDGVTVDSNHLRNYNGTFRLSKQNNGTWGYTDGGGWLGQGNMGSWTDFTTAPYYANDAWYGRGDNGGCVGVVASTPTEWLTYDRGGANTTITVTAFDGSYSKTFAELSDLSNATSDGVDTFYVLQTVDGTIYKIRNGTITGYGGSGVSQYNAARGIAYYNGDVYVSMYTRHRIDKYNVAGNSRAPQWIGLVAPAL